MTPSSWGFPLQCHLKFYLCFISRFCLSLHIFTWLVLDQVVSTLVSMMALFQQLAKSLRNEPKKSVHRTKQRPCSFRRISHLYTLNLTYSLSENKSISVSNCTRLFFYISLAKLPDKSTRLWKLGCAVSRKCISTPHFNTMHGSIEIYSPDSILIHWGINTLT